MDKIYNLLMSAGDDAWTSGEAALDMRRFLEHTDDPLRARFQSLDGAAVEELKSVPALFAHERQIGAPARVGWLTSIESEADRVRITFKFDQGIPPVSPDVLESLAVLLKIHAWEFHRVHWAVKSADLLAVIANAAALVAQERAMRGEYKFGRQTVLKACDLLRMLGHSDLDRLLLEIGIDELQAKCGAGVGSKAQRTNALAQYVLTHPEQRTAEGESLALAVVRRAANMDPEYPAERYDLDASLREAFWTRLSADGYTFSDGTVLPDVAEPSATPRHAAAAGSAPAVLAKTASETPKAPHVPPPMPPPKGADGSPPKVFVVHGRDEGAKDAVARFLERLGLEPIILHERPSRGRTLITKFQEESADIHFAVVLMTPDDIGGLAGSSEQNFRARQNVIFELGFFIGKLGASRVCALVSGDIEKPSDFDAVVYIPYGAGTGWKADLARELHHAEISFDASKVFR